MTKTWKELKAEGVVRCCVTFKGGGRCRRRADESGWCNKHRATMVRWEEWGRAVARGMKGAK